MILKSIHLVEDSLINTFSCGNKDLDKFFKKYAKDNDTAGYGKTFVLFDEEKLVGFFTLCSAQIRFDSFPYSFEENLPKYPIPAIRIARLAVDAKMQKKGYGKELLKEAFYKIVNASQTIGIKIVVVDAKESSKSFYEKYGFIKLVDDRLTYCIHIQTIIDATNANKK